MNKDQRLTNTRSFAGGSARGETLQFRLVEKIPYARSSFHFTTSMSVGCNLALAAPLGLQLPGFANAPSSQTGLLQQALRPKKARVLH